MATRFGSGCSGPQHGRLLDGEHAFGGDQEFDRHQIAKIDGHDSPPRIARFDDHNGRRRISDSDRADHDNDHGGRTTVQQ